MSSPLSRRLLEWRCDVAIASGYLQDLYQAIDRKQWDRAGRMGRSATEALARHHPESKAIVAKGRGDLQSLYVLPEWQNERYAWLLAIKALMCIGSFYSMAHSEDRSLKGLQGMRTECDRALAVALLATKTAFPEEDFQRLVEEAIEQALSTTEMVLEADLQASGSSGEVDPKTLALTARMSCEGPLRAFVKNCMGP